MTELLSRHAATAVGIGAAGFVDETGENVLFAPNLAWRNEPLKKQVQERTGLPVLVENDANAAAWAEVTLGAARGHQDAVLISVGTGIGAGFVLDGELYRGTVRGGRRARALPGSAGRAAVRLRQPGLLGAVRQRQRAGRGGARVRQAVA